MPSPSGVTLLLPPGRPPKMPGPCFHCGEMGHLRTFCPKLHRQQYPLSNVVQSMCVDKPELHGQQYPLSTVVQSVCVNKPRGELMGSTEKVESINGIDVSGDHYPCGIMENKKCDSTGLSTESSLGLEESNGSSGDLARCWEVEQGEMVIRKCQRWLC